MSSPRYLSRRFQTLSQLKKFSIKLPERFKGGRIEKYLQFWKLIADDYKMVLKEAVDDAKASKVKSAILFSAFGFLGYAYKTNPDYNDFVDTFVSGNCDIGLVSDAIRKRESERYLDFLWSHLNAGTLRFLNVGIFSVLWIDDYSKDCQLYEARCTYLSPRYSTFHERIVDVGFVNSWWNLKRKLRDYDVGEWNGTG